jgi:hypothetical protein
VEFNFSETAQHYNLEDVSVMYMCGCVNQNSVSVESLGDILCMLNTLTLLLASYAYCTVV